ncbi:MAG: DUF1304 domain-containing protein [Actinomycetota bacterium]|nr:DUF1304 domain-containing protein [Actinomycetota bacterium]
MFIVIAAVLAALVHVYIFVIESLRFVTPSTMKAFGVRSAEEAQIMKPWAFNQGFYNLFLAIIAAVGAVVFAAAVDGSAEEAVGRTLIWAAVAAMLGAAVVLVGSDRSKGRGAAVQGLFPLLTIIALLVR